MNSKRNTIILFVVLAIVIGGGFLIQKIFFGKEGAKAIVTQNGKAIKELPLNKETQLTLDDTNGGTNTLVVKDGSICMTEANCPDLVCVYTGNISHTGEVIACLPHGLIITIQDPEDALDGTAW